jgi:hypothetical protein
MCEGTPNFSDKFARLFNALFAFRSHSHGLPSCTPPGYLGRARQKKKTAVMSAIERLLLQNSRLVAELSCAFFWAMTWQALPLGEATTVSTLGNQLPAVVGICSARSLTPGQRRAETAKVDQSSIGELSYRPIIRLVSFEKFTHELAFRNRRGLGCNQIYLPGKANLSSSGDDAVPDRENQRNLLAHRVGSAAPGCS